MLSMHRGPPVVGAGRIVGSSLVGRWPVGCSMAAMVSRPPGSLDGFLQVLDRRRSLGTRLVVLVMVLMSTLGAGFVAGPAGYCTSLVGPCGSPL